MKKFLLLVALSLSTATLAGCDRPKDIIDAIDALQAVAAPS